jgi:hypothetical protein
MIFFEAMEAWTLTLLKAEITKGDKKQWRQVNGCKNPRLPWSNFPNKAKFQIEP